MRRSEATTIYYYYSTITNNLLLVASFLAAEDAVASNNIRSRWNLFQNKNNDGMVKLGEGGEERRLERSDSKSIILPFLHK